MINLIKSLRYLIFRIIYTLTHYLVFKIKNKEWKACREKSSDEYIIICGIEFNSDENIQRIKQFKEFIKQKFPEKQIIHLSKNVHEIGKNTEQDIKCIPWEYETRARLISPLFKILYRKGHNTKDENEVKNYLKNCRMIYDLGKKQVSSDLGTGWTANVMANIITSARFQKPYIMFTQKFGPFNYPHIFGIIFKFMLRNIFPEIVRVYPEDEESSENISRFIPSEKIIRNNFYDVENQYC
ncbi:MAG: hypothetical protein JW864_01990 [Spirochaetes bacterium]|nr:hypothetical protein [Spirochaetota bacterium]